MESREETGELRQDSERKPQGGDFKNRRLFFVTGCRAASRLLQKFRVDLETYSVSSSLELHMMSYICTLE